MKTDYSKSLVDLKEKLIGKFEKLLKNKKSNGVNQYGDELIKKGVKFDKKVIIGKLHLRMFIMM